METHIINISTLLCSEKAKHVPAYNLHVPQVMTTTSVGNASSEANTFKPKIKPPVEVQLSLQKLKTIKMASYCNATQPASRMHTNKRALFVHYIQARDFSVLAVSLDIC